MGFTVHEQLPAQKAPARIKGLAQLTAYRDAMHKNPGMWVGADFHDLRPGERVAALKSCPVTGIATRIRKAQTPFDDGYVYEAYTRGARLYARVVTEDD